MSKAILLIDMPERCRDCSIRNPVGKLFCIKELKEVSEKEYYEKKPDWCPLRPLPEKMQVCGKYPQPDGIVPSYKVGFNACIDQILKGSEENG